MGIAAADHTKVPTHTARLSLQFPPPASEKYLSALGQSPEAIALMKINPSRFWLQSFKSWSRKLVPTFNSAACAIAPAPLKVGSKLFLKNSNRISMKDFELRRDCSNGMELGI
jgi:hypothetical protein